ncbi:MAG TPA: hypothetical protein VGX48_08365 [Pyrinomonadaceae bacterium]|jgi:hypothetical protein|nr:hypothetical protein [Pyrinomonadaceae bacterium]
MSVRHWGQFAAILILALCSSPVTHSQKAALRLTDEDRRAIVESVVADGFAELHHKLEKPNILNNCLTPILNDEEVAFISTKGIKSSFFPKLPGVHFVFMTPDEINAQIRAEDGECYFEFGRFEVVGAKVMVHFGKYLRRPTYIYGESFKYEYSKVRGKWKGKYVGKLVIES